MFNVKEILLLLMAAFFLLLTLFGREKIALRAMAFSLPFGILFPTPNIPIGLNGVLIWAIWLAIIIRESHFQKPLISWQVISKKVLWLYYFLVAGVIVGLFQIENLDTHTLLSPSEQILNFSLFIITIILFIKIMVNYRDDLKFHEQLRVVFIGSVFLQLLSFILPMLGSSAFSQDLVMSSSVEFNDSQIRSDVKRFSGVIGDYELIIDYVMIVIALAYGFLISNRYKLISITALVIAISVGFLSGTRSFLIVLPLFFLLYFIITNLYVGPRVVSAQAFMSYIIILGVVGLVFYLFRDLPVFIRFQEAIGLYKQGGTIDEASNRRFVEALPDFFSKTSVIGNGSFYYNTLGGSELVSHNLLMATYAKYGIIGVGLMLFLFIKPVFMLLKKGRESNLAATKREAVIFASLVIALFAQELKISALRYQTTMLLYAFLFVLIYYYLYSKETKIENS